MELSWRQKGVLAFIQQAHYRQVRKYTGEPYYTHPLAVAEICNKYCPDTFGLIEIALLHDVLEDTPYDKFRIIRELREVGYSIAETRFIIKGVEALTDVYTHAEYPELNRKSRKELENNRLAKIDTRYQTVKYADLLHNTMSIVEHDPSFSKVYVVEKSNLLLSMDKGDPVLRKLCANIVISISYLVF